MVLRISPDTFWSALRSSVFILYLYVIQKRNELLLSCSYPGPRSIAIGKHCDVTATCILLPFVFLWPSKPICCPLSWLLQCYYPQKGRLSLSIQKISTWHQGIHNIFPYTFVTPFLVSLPDCLVGTVLSRHVHPPTTTHKYIQHAIDATPVISSRYQYKQEEGLTVLGASIDRQLVPQISLAWTKHNLS